MLLPLTPAGGSSCSSCLGLRVLTIADSMDQHRAISSLEGGRPGAVSITITCISSLRLLEDLFMSWLEVATSCAQRCHPRRCWAPMVGWSPSTSGRAVAASSTLLTLVVSVMVRGRRCSAPTRGTSWPSLPFTADARLLIVRLHCGADAPFCTAATRARPPEAVATGLPCPSATMQRARVRPSCHGAGNVVGSCVTGGSRARQFDGRDATAATPTPTLHGIRSHHRATRAAHHVVAMCPTGKGGGTWARRRRRRRGRRRSGTRETTEWGPPRVGQTPTAATSAAAVRRRRSVLPRRRLARRRLHAATDTATAGDAPREGAVACVFKAVAGVMVGGMARPVTGASLRRTTRRERGGRRP